MSAKQERAIRNRQRATSMLGKIRSKIAVLNKQAREWKSYRDEQVRVITKEAVRESKRKKKS